MEALRTQQQVFGQVASDTTAGRALGQIGDRRRAAIAAVRARARAHVWAQLPGGVPESRFAGGAHQPGMVVLRIDGTLVPVYSKKDKAAGTFKKSYGMHPLACWVDNTGELASLLLRGGGAGSNTTTDLITVLGEAIAQVPKPYRRKLLITSDAAGASHGLIDWLVRQNHASDRCVEFSVGFDVDAGVRTAIGQVRADCWVPAVDNTDGTVRGDADVTEITQLLQDRLARTGWPRRLRVIVRRTRLAEGEQPTLFHPDGYKYSCFVTTTTGLRLQQLDARHRAHARVEDQVRTTKDTGLGHLPSKSWQVNTGWCHAVAIACDLLAWFKLLGCTGHLARAEPKTLRYRMLAVPAKLTRGQRRRRLRLPRHWPWAEALATAIGKIRRMPLPEPQPG